MAPRIGHLGIDAAGRTSENGNEPDAALRWVFPDEEGAGIRIEVNERGERLVRGMHRAIATLAREGTDVIFETVLLGHRWRDDLLEALSGLEVTFVGVCCPLEVIEERERQRGNRVVGQARGHYGIVHDGMTYDIEVDTSTLQPHEAAEKIAELLKGLVPPISKP